MAKKNLPKLGRLLEKFQQRVHCGLTVVVIDVRRRKTIQLIAPVADHAQHIAQLVLDIIEHLVGIIIGSVLNFLAFSHRPESHLFQFLLSLVANLFHFRQGGLLNCLAVEQHLLAQLICLYLRLLEQAHIV